MYLKRLEMRGFKSFADKTNIDFDNGVTCIVGPNGSGKSNITDAVRWVLGEQKVKTLRGSKMEDIIFNGTDRRKKLGMAEVSLIFDNSERFFSLDFNEVKVCRRVYRSGESEYIINDTNCRLKDVRDLFMDTGIGTDGYSIIGQGRIERILSNNMDERRLLFEEAAGIVKYKTRKRETERKLENTEVNLIRINDIFSELASRVEPLRIESEKAKRHLEVSDRLSELELNLFINEIESINKKIQKEDLNFQNINSELEINNKAKSGFVNEKNRYNEKIDNLNIELQNIKNSFFEDKNKITNIDGEINVLKIKIDSTDINIIRLGEERKKNNLKIKNIDDSNKIVTIKKENIEDSLNKVRALTNTKSKEFEDVSKKLYNLESESSQLRESVISKLNDIEKNKSEIGSYNTILENHLYRKKELVLEISDTKLEIDIELSKDGDHENQLNGLVSTEKSLSVEKLKLKESIKKSEEILNRDGIIINDFKKKLTEYSTEASLLKQMEKDHTGFDFSVKKALKFAESKPELKKDINVVAGLMSIPKEYEIALEVSLGKSIQNIVTETPSDAKAIISELKRTKSGRVTFIPLSSIEVKGDQKHILEILSLLDGYIGKANKLFDYDKKYNVLYDYLVGRTVVVKDVNTATEALKIKGLKYKVVTLDGDVFIPGGTITGGSYKSRSAGILGRKRKIIDLDIKIEEINESIYKLSKSIDEVRENYKNEVFELEENNKISEAIRLEIVKKESEISQVKDHLSRLSTLISKRKSESIIIENDIKSVYDAVFKREKNIEILDVETKNMEEKLVSDTTSLEEFKNNIEVLRSELTEVKVKNASLLESHKSILFEITRFKSENDEAFKVEVLNKTLINDYENEIIVLNKEVLLLRNKKSLVIKTSSSKNDDIELFKKNILEFTNKIKEINSTNSELFESIESLKEILHKIEIKKAKYDVHREDIATRLFDRYEITPEDAILCKKDIDMSSANKEIKLLKSELKQIGDISTSSIEEYAEVSERYLFLKTQHDDLVDARNTLRKLIKEMEKVMIEKFLECFETVKIHFGEIFQSLFIGGKAELSIKDLDNILESDIGIDIQPPGKKLQNITLLSGGEKALTAIALLFAILKTKPAPFCILDEIEAALDDVNVYRFADFLKEFTQNSQFVIITHRKGTMEIADNLFGVTMEEFGVSKIISVKLEDAIYE